MRLKQPGEPLRTVFKPEKDFFVGDVDLEFDAGKMLFSSIGSHNRWQVFEIGLDGSGFRQVTRGEEVDIDNYDPVYLPDGRNHLRFDQHLPRCALCGRQPIMWRI